MIQTENLLMQLRDITQKNPEEIFKRIKSLFQVSENSNLHLQQYISLIKKGYSPIMYANHQSHADGIILSIVIEKMREGKSPEYIQGFLCPIAASIGTGEQDITVQGVSDIFLPIFKRKGLITISVIREDDRKKYGMIGSNKDAIEKLLHAPRDGYGLAIFPEGRVQGGRMDKDGKIYGMQQAEEGGIFIIKCLIFWNGQGKESVLLPIGIINSYKIFSPDNYFVSKKIVDMISGKKEITKIAEIAIGEPYTTKDIQKDLGTLPDAKNQEHIVYLMDKIAKLLPEEARGYYSIKK